MAITIIRYNLEDLGRPLTQALRVWARKNREKLPCWLVQPTCCGIEEFVPVLPDPSGNYVSAIPASKHPQFYARRDPVTREVSFPFWEDCGKGSRRQDMEPVYIAVPVFAVFNSPDSPIVPLDISRLPQPEDTA